MKHFNFNFKLNLYYFKWEYLIIKPKIIIIIKLKIVIIISIIDLLDHYLLNLVPSFPDLIACKYYFSFPYQVK